MSSGQNTVNWLKRKRKIIESVNWKIKDNNRWVQDSSDDEVEKVYSFDQTDQLPEPLEEEPEFQDIEEELLEEESAEKDLRNKIVQILSGRWNVESHLINGQEYLNYFLEKKLEVESSDDFSFEGYYQFNERIGFRIYQVSGIIQDDDNEMDYVYKSSLTVSYEVESENSILIRVESGYQYQKVGERMEIRDFSPDDQTVRIEFEQKDQKTLVFKEEDEVKILKLQESE